MASVTNIHYKAYIRGTDHHCFALAEVMVRNFGSVRSILFQFLVSVFLFDNHFIIMVQIFIVFPRYTFMCLWSYQVVIDYLLLCYAPYDSCMQ